VIGGGLESPTGSLLENTFFSCSFPTKTFGQNRKYGKSNSKFLFFENRKMTSPKSKIETFSQIKDRKRYTVFSFSKVYNIHNVGTRNLVICLIFLFFKVLVFSKTL